MMNELDRIAASDLPEMDRLAQAFRWVTDRILEQEEREVELLRAMGDREALTKEQIKLGMMRHAQEIFQQCFRRIAGRKAWDD